MEPIKLDYSRAGRYAGLEDIQAWAGKIARCHILLHKGGGPGSEYRGWVDWPQRCEKADLDRIKALAEKIRQQAEVFLVVGIGGSYLGARAALEMLLPSFYNELPREKRNGPKLYYMGHNLSASYIHQLLDIVAGQELAINVISKSGTTTETALALGILKQYLEDKYGQSEASQRIYATTDKSRGELLALARQEGYATLVIPEDIGGRYSVLTPVGLLPMAVAGIDIDQVMAGARAAAGDLGVSPLQDNSCYQYAALRNILYGRGFAIEIMVSYEPGLVYFGEWFKQLFGESEGKQGKGIFPTAMSFTTDLHSLGQYIQEGPRTIFETILKVGKSREDLAINWGLSPNYLRGKTLSYVNQKALEGTLAAHSEGGVPCLLLNIPELTPYYFGYLVYFFEKACAISAYLLGVNPFDQPGVEAYKHKMLELLK